MPKLKPSTNPKYRLHKGSRQAVVTLNGVDHYLGPWNSKASIGEYDRLVGQWRAGGRRLPDPEADLTIVEVVARFRRFAKGHYRKNGKPTGEARNLMDAIRPVLHLFGREPVREFGPLKLQAARALMIDGYTDKSGHTFRPLSRKVINSRVHKIRWILRWGVSQELVPAELMPALDAVTALKAGRTKAKERPPVRSVEDSVVDATLPHLPAVVADMVRLQRLTGCRPGEVCALKPAHLDRTGEVWQAVLEDHKTVHHSGVPPASGREFSTARDGSFMILTAGQPHGELIQQVVVEGQRIEQVVHRGR